MDLKIFKAYDIRGVYPNQLDEAGAELIGKAVGTLLEGKQSIVVGYDVRESSKKINYALIKGLLSTGCNVIDVGTVPSPIVYFYAFSKKIHGVMITASHNPPQYSGFKFIRPTGVSYIEEYKDVKALVEKGEFIKGEGRLREDDGIKPYEEFLIKNVDVKKPTKVVVDCMNATGGIINPEFYEKFNVQVIPIREKPLGDFGGIRPEPKGSKLDQLRQKVVEEGADFGIAYDGDVDRSVLVDDKGRDMVGSITIMVMMEHFLNLYPDRPIVATLDCASEIEVNAKLRDANVIWTKVGHGFIEDTVHKNNAVFGGEQSSHFYGFGLYPFSDGIITCLKTAEFLSTIDKKLSEVVDSLNLHPTYKEYFDCGDEENKIRVIDSLIKRFENELRVSKIDGVKFFINDIEWIMIRKSNTNPEVCLCIEALNESRMKELHEEYSEIIKMVIEKE